MKKLAIVQILLGLLIVFFSIASIDHGRFTEPSQQPNLGGDPPQVITDALPPNDAVFEFLTLAAGLAVTGCGIAQRKTRTKLTGWQISFGVNAVFASAVLGITIVNDAWVTGSIFYLAYLTLVLGLAISIIGFTQFREVQRSA